MNCESCKVEIATESAIGGRCARCAAKAPAPKAAIAPATVDSETIIEHEKNEPGHAHLGHAHTKAEPADHGKSSKHK